MTHVIGLLMLALSLLQAVHDNPQLPEPFKAQATSVALQAISEANKALVQPSTAVTIPSMNDSQTPEAVGAPAPAVAPLTVYILKNENDPTLFYYAGEKNLASVTVDGKPADITQTRYLDDCIGSGSDKICGYYMARFTGNGAALVLTSDDGSVFTGTVKQ